MIPDNGHAGSSDDAVAKLKQMILDSLEPSGGEEWLRKHGGEHLIERYRRMRKAAPENSGAEHA